MTCHFCNGGSGAPADHRLIQGWERRSHNPSRRGGSDVYLREPHPSGQWACEVCIRKVRDGIAISQESLSL